MVVTDIFMKQKVGADETVSGSMWHNTGSVIESDAQNLKPLLLSEVNLCASLLRQKLFSTSKYFQL